MNENEERNFRSHQDTQEELLGLRRNENGHEHARQVLKKRTDDVEFQIWEGLKDVCGDMECMKEK